MAMTKVEAAKLTNDLLLRGVVETIVKESSVLQLLPFMEVTGTSVTYNREATMPAATFYDVGDTWTTALQRGCYGLEAVTLRGSPFGMGSAWTEGMKWRYSGW